jgi:hypothetical protein
MRAITICMLVALTVNGTTLLAQKPGKAAKPGKAEEPGHVRTITREIMEKPIKPSAVVKGVGTLGIEVFLIDPRVRNYLSIPDGFGVSVNHVSPSGPAGQAGLKRHVIILKIDDQWVSNTYHYEALVRRLGPGHKATILVKDFGKAWPGTTIGTPMSSGKNSGRVLTIKEYTVEVVIGETDGLPLVDPVRPFDWSKKPDCTFQSNGVTFHYRDDSMFQAINAEGVIRLQNWRGYDWAEYLPKEEFPFADIPQGVGGVDKGAVGPQVLGIGYEAVEEKPKVDKPKQAPKRKP